MVIDRLSRQEKAVKKECYHNQTWLNNIHRTPHLQMQKTSFSGPNGLFTKIDCILMCKARINEYQNTEIIQNMLSDNNGIKLWSNKNKI